MVDTCAEFYPSNFSYTAIQAEDSSAYKVLQHLGEVRSLIDRTRMQGQRILVHCFAGVLGGCSGCTTCADGLPRGAGGRRRVAVRAGGHGGWGRVLQGGGRVARSPRGTPSNILQLS